MPDRGRIYQEILHRSRRRSDRARWRADHRWAEIEASHMAVILPLLRCADERRHRHYLEIDKPRYVRHFKSGDTREFEPLWAELAALVTPPAEIPFAATEGPILLGYSSH